MTLPCAVPSISFANLRARHWLVTTKQASRCRPLHPAPHMRHSVSHYSHTTIAGCCYIRRPMTNVTTVSATCAAPPLSCSQFVDYNLLGGLYQPQGLGLTYVVTCFTLRKFSRPHSPSSRPKPLFLLPPQGACGSSSTSSSKSELSANKLMSNQSDALIGLLIVMLVLTLYDMLHMLHSPPTPAPTHEEPHPSHAYTPGAMSPRFLTGARCLKCPRCPPCPKCYMWPKCPGAAAAPSALGAPGAMSAPGA